MHKTALVLEGGGLRGIFTAGVVDCLLENKIVFDYAIGVSAGACNLFAYVGGQRRYIKKCMIQKNPFDSFYGVPQAIESHRLVDLDKVFEEYSETYGFDFERFIQSPIRWEMVVSNMRTGQAEYLHADDIEEAKLIGKASCSLPIITPPVRIGEDLYLDGGICDSIPVQRALDLGYDRVLVVLTRKKGNFSRINDATKLVFSRLYGSYPDFLKTAFDRGNKYREEVALCERLEAEQKAIIIRPTMQEVNRLESDEDELSMSYYHGYTKAKEYIAQLKQWFV